MFFYVRIYAPHCRVDEAFVMHVKNGNDDGRNKVRNLLYLVTAGTSNNTTHCQQYFF